ncbi:MAG: hypothetical protein H6667_12465 [Ardenticatenaceae bacterium]|nr:hypothetical protein [Ardenticatenaceae bacterium]MCB9443551.1 hypothetical protein [Ardenticatenaceae bacterium]
MFRKQSQSLLLVGLTAVFTAYFLIWLPGSAVGLQFIGVEIGEWIKFLGVGMGRNWFYVPPVTLGLMLSLVTLTWPPRRWQNWVMRGLGIVVSLLSFPAIEAIRFEAASEWRLRLLLIGGVVLTAVLAGLAERSLPDWLPWLLLVVLGIVGAVFPFWFYLQIRPLVSQAVGLPVGIGPGVWLNGAGHLLVTAVAIQRLRVKKDRVFLQNPAL